MSDKIKFNYILGRLENISENIIKFSKDFQKELLKLKKKGFNSDDSSKQKALEYYPKKFFENFLKPLLEKNLRMTKSDIKKVCEHMDKYNSGNTLNKYLYLLELHGKIKSERDSSNCKIYELNILF